MGNRCQYRVKNGCAKNCMNESGAVKGVSIFSLSLWDSTIVLNLLALLGFSGTFQYNPSTFFICSEHFTPDSIETGPNGKLRLKNNPTLANMSFTIITPAIDSSDTLFKGLLTFYEGKLPDPWRIAMTGDQFSIYKMTWKASGGLQLEQEIVNTSDLEMYWFIGGIHTITQSLSSLRSRFSAASILL